LTQSCWSGSQNQYCFAPDVKSGRTAIKQKFPGSDESIPKRPSISPKKAAERAAERAADKARKEAEKPNRKREYDCNIKSEVLVQKKKMELMLPRALLLIVRLRPLHLLVQMQLRTSHHFWNYQ
jgi:hypothetical protein